MSKHVTAWFIALCIAFSANAASAQGAAILTQDYYLHYGQNLAAGCKYKLTFQNDGNLVLTDWQRRTIWSSGTAGRGRFVQMQPDGNLVIYDFARNAVWSTRTVNGTIGTKLQLQGDRNLVVYDGHGKALWSSRTVDNSNIGVSISPCNWRASKTGMWAGWDTVGEYLTHAFMTVRGVDTAEVCANWCASNSQCRAFTYVPAGFQGAQPVCWQKKTLDYYVLGSGLSSGQVDRFSDADGNF